MRIEDGRGTGREAGVSPESRLLVAATVDQEAAAAAAVGNAFTITSGFTPLVANAGESGVLYVKNTSERPLRIAILEITTKAATKVRIYRNPTSGTLPESGLQATVTNMNFGSSREFIGKALRGSSGDTITDGEIFSTVHLASGGPFTSAIPTNVLLPTGSSIAVSFESESPTANSASAQILIYRSPAVTPEE